MEQVVAPVLIRNHTGLLFDPLTQVKVGRLGMVPVVLGCLDAFNGHLIDGIPEKLEILVDGGILSSDMVDLGGEGADLAGRIQGLGERGQRRVGKDPG